MTGRRLRLRPKGVRNVSSAPFGQDVLGGAGRGMKTDVGFVRRFGMKRAKRRLVLVPRKPSFHRHVRQLNLRIPFVRCLRKARLAFPYEARFDQGPRLELLVRPQRKRAFRRHRLVGIRSPVSTQRGLIRPFRLRHVTPVSGNLRVFRRGKPHVKGLRNPGRKPFGLDLVLRQPTRPIRFGRKNRNLRHRLRRVLVRP